ncbi:uncharacterized protein BCR38DRAFT_414052 [Pseudomassariella vexata]|uniref:Secreted protein n=1 Tax=Pseudomassariella vexata TaxID=1141098 RepID=A0A1Y2DD45_9PEZI|nr:uncharacterized protein BCR38DRAFT_414052 [Pseudomassariella vexata]ORY57202.1 hypothetical protein BCR38DRAFT_414052 [Pseudomassariella vexata]
MLRVPCMILLLYILERRARMSQTPTFTSAAERCIGLTAVPSEKSPCPTLFVLLDETSNHSHAKSESSAARSGGFAEVIPPLDEIWFAAAKTFFGPLDRPSSE